MIKSFQKNKALTLTELLISSALIAIVMIGVTSFSLSVKGYHDTVNRISNLSMQAAATMAMIKKDAAQAVGDVDHPGIIQQNDAIGAIICFRHDHDDDPASYAGDQWFCYMQGADFDLNRCGPMVDADDAFFTGGAWDATIPAACLNTLNTLLPLTQAVGGVRPPWVTLVRDAAHNNRLQYIDVTLEALYDRTAAENSLTNPRIELNAHIYPLGMSWE